MPKGKSEKAAPVVKKVEKTAKKVVKETQNVVENTAKKVSPKKLELRFDKAKVIRGLMYLGVFLVAFGLIDLVVQYLNNDYSMAVVNGSRISRNVYYSRLSKAYGLQASSTIIDEELIIQEGNKKNIKVTKEDIENRIKDISESIGGEKVFEETLKSNNLTRKDVERQIKIELIYTKILQPTLKYEEKDVKDFFDKYKDYLYEGQKDVKFEDKKDEVEKQFVDQKIEEAKQSWLTGLRENARIQNNIKEKPKYGFFKTVSNIVNNVMNEAKQAQK